MALLHCLGGGREVGNNAFLLQAKKKNIMLDFGMKVETNELPLKPPAHPDALFLSHGHLDHIGSGPALFNKKSLKVYGTKVTADLCRMLLKDSLKIARIKKLIRKFTTADIRKFNDNWTNINYRQIVKVGDIKVQAIDAGHIPGSCMFLITIGRKKILYTGDFKMDSTRLVDGANVDIKNIDTVIMETTYSSREHPGRAQSEKELVKLVNSTVRKGGIALIPSFAIRAPEILLILYKNNVKHPIYLDGMAKTSAEIALKNPKFLRNSIDLKKALQQTTVIKNHLDRTDAIKKPGIIVTTGGCLDGGPIVHYIKHLYSRKDCSLILTGYQIPKTAGRYLVDTGRLVNEEVDLKLAMPIHQLDFSGHAGRKELLRFVKNIRPKTIICIHGDHCQRFATELRGRYKIEAIAPKAGDVINI